AGTGRSLRIRGDAALRAGIRSGTASRWPTLATRGLAGHHPAEPEDHAQPHHRMVRQACRRASSALYGARLATLNKPSSQPAPLASKKRKNAVASVTYATHQAVAQVLNSPPRSLSQQ